MRMADHDRQIRAKHAAGMPVERIAASLRLSPIFVRHRLGAMALSPNDGPSAGWSDRNRALIPPGVTAPIWSDDWWRQCHEKFRQALISAYGGDHASADRNHCCGVGVRDVN